MVDRQHIERVLRLNNVDITATREDVSSVLNKVGFSEADIQNFFEQGKEVRTASEPGVKQATVKPTIKSAAILKTDSSLKPEHVRELLGIDMHVSTFNTPYASVYKRQGASFLQILAIAFFSLVFAGLGVVGFMWHLEVGIFHIASTL